MNTLQGFHGCVQLEQYNNQSIQSYLRLGKTEKILYTHELQKTILRNCKKILFKNKIVCTLHYTNNYSFSLGSRKCNHSLYNTKLLQLLSF